MLGLDWRDGDDRSGGRPTRRLQPLVRCCFGEDDKYAWSESTGRLAGLSAGEMESGSAIITAALH